MNSLFSRTRFRVPAGQGICAQDAGIAARLDAENRPEGPESKNSLLFWLFIVG
jgi:hypothetical protein